MAAGESLSSVSLTFFANRAGTPTFKGDLYGLGFRVSSTVLGTDYITGSLDTTDATVVQDNFLSPTFSTAAGTNATTNSVGNSALLNYLNAQYSAGAVGGNFVFLRISADYAVNPGTATSSSIGYAANPADSTTAGRRPFLTVTTVPEPTGALLVAAGLGLLLGRRRQRLLGV